MSAQRTLTHLSLFSGYGGLDIAARWAGFETVAQVEFADYPHTLLAKRFPRAALFRDIRDFTMEAFYEATGLRTVDLVSGGFPCQPFSQAGKRKGTNDYRYLWPEMLRVIDITRPSWVVAENVAGIVSMAQPVGEPYLESRTLSRFEDTDYYHGVFSQQEDMLLFKILGDLRDLGYEVQPVIIPACAVEAPHERQRIAILAHANGGGHLHKRDEVYPADTGQQA